MLAEKLLPVVKSAPPDPYFEYNALLLTGDGTNGAQNNTFLDSSTNNFTITRNGNTTQGTFSPYGNLWSNYFDGSGDYLTLTGSALGSGNFTIEFWLNPQQLLANGSILDIATSGTDGFLIRQNTNGILVYDRTTSTILVSTSSGFSVGTWAHVAVVRNSNTVTLYVNGISAGSASDSTNFTQTAYYICAFFNSAVSPNQFNGYLSNLRVTNTALYTSNFTPSTTPLTAVSGTSLLTCQSNRFIDNSSNNFTLTVNGNTSVQRFSPFNPTAPYSAATLGGSGYFDGNGDTLETPSIGVSNSIFCYECWLYPTVTQGAATGIFVANTNNGLQLSYYDTSGSGGLGIAQKGVAWQLYNSDGKKPIVGQWNHVAFVRSGTGTNQTSIFLNGVRVANGTVSYTYTASNYQISTTNAGGTVFQGYMSGSRLTLGSTPYDATQSTITIPTTPPTPITNTTLLLNYTNAGIPDAAMMNDLETVGNAQVSTSVKKYGTGSLAFDGSGDYLYKGATNYTTNFGTGAFTIEAWVYPTATGVQCIVDTRLTDGSATGLYFGLYSSNQLLLFTNNTITSGGTVSTNTWTHVAIVKNSTTITLYVNGTSVATVSNSANLTDGNCQIGASTTVSGSSANYWNGYIDDLRITKGYARYTANFTPPTAALPTY